MPGSMKLTALKMNSRGVIQLLRDPGVAADLARRGAAIEAALPHANGEEWSVRSSQGFDRAQTTVRAVNHAARQQAIENHALQRGLDAGR